MPHDTGPVYLETVMGRFPVEPWNTFSNLLFLALIVYWFVRVRRDLAAHRFIAFALPVLFVGWVGGTVYHATRSHDVWLFLDFVPIALLVVAVALYLWRRQGVPWVLAVLLVFGPIVGAGAIASLVGAGEGGPIWGYPVLGLAILLPVMRHLAREQWQGSGLVAAALLVFLIAVGFRSIDLRVPIAFLPMGTHWLWHSFGAAAVQLLILYLYRSDRRAAAAGGVPQPAAA